MGHGKKRQNWSDILGSIFPKGLFYLEPVIRMSPEHISVGVWKFEFNLGRIWKIQCYLI